MMRLFYWLGIFVLTTLVVHLSYVLFMPRYEAQALVRDMRRQAGINTFQPLRGPVLRRLVRHPLPDASYGLCALQVDGNRSVLLHGPDLRALWALTVHSTRGDVLYAITDRHVPPGAMNVLFEYRPQTQEGEIALPKLSKGNLVVPLRVRRALLVLEVFPRHVGQRKLVRTLVSRLRCTEQKRTSAMKPQAPVPAADTGQLPEIVPARDTRSTMPMPRPRPVRP